MCQKIVTSILLTISGPCQGIFPADDGDVVAGEFLTACILSVDITIRFIHRLACSTFSIVLSASSLTDEVNYCSLRWLTVLCRSLH